MLGVSITRGAVYRHQARHRTEISIDDDLRRDTVKLIEEIRQVLRRRAPQPLANDIRCRDCSLHEACAPDVLDAARRGAQHADLYHAVDEDDASWPDRS